MAGLRRSLGRLRRVLVPQRQVLERAVERIESHPALDEELDSYYRDVADHLWRVVDEVEAARDTLQGLLDAYTKEVQERLTIVATIFLPLTVLTAFFGMNFNWLISHIGSAGTFWGLGVGGLIVSGAGIRLWLVHAGMYHSRRSKPRGERRARRTGGEVPGRV